MVFKSARLMIAGVFCAMICSSCELIGSPSSKPNNTPPALCDWSMLEFHDAKRAVLAGDRKYISDKGHMCDRMEVVDNGVILMYDCIQWLKAHQNILIVRSESVRVAKTWEEEHPRYANRLRRLGCFESAKKSLGIQE